MEKTTDKVVVYKGRKNRKAGRCAIKKKLPERSSLTTKMQKMSSMELNRKKLKQKHKHQLVEDLCVVTGSSSLASKSVGVLNNHEIVDLPKSLTGCILSKAADKEYHNEGQWTYLYGSKEAIEAYRPEAIASSPHNDVKGGIVRDLPRLLNRILKQAIDVRDIVITRSDLNEEVSSKQNFSVLSEYF